jgi:hypothetical protein
MLSMSNSSILITKYLCTDSCNILIRRKPKLEVKETTYTASSASFLDLYLEFDDSGQLSTKIYDKRDDFNFKIYENASLIIVSAETEYISTRSWYRNINFLRDRIRRIFFIALVQ